MQTASKRLASTLLAGAALGGCVSHASVLRTVDGRRVEVRYVDGEAYAAYVEGAAREAWGDLDGALRAYAVARDRDPKSPEIGTRIGAVFCKKGDPAAARAAFDRAAELDPDYEEAWTESSRCHLATGDARLAVDDAERAIAIDPERIEPVLALAEALERAGRMGDAARWLDGLALRSPDRAAFEALLGFARRHKDAARELTAREALGLLPEPSLATLDTLLVRERYDDAQRLARALHLSGAEIALRAASLGRAEWARERASRISAADPLDPDARIALGVAADLLGDEAAFARAWSDVPRNVREPCPLGKKLLAQLLERRIPDLTRAARSLVR
jgi:tetratricopeptide (TPR) repeat protein